MGDLVDGGHGPDRAAGVVRRAGRPGPRRPAGRPRAGGRARPALHLAPLRRRDHRDPGRCARRRRRRGGVLRPGRRLGRHPRPDRPRALHGRRDGRCAARRRRDGDLAALVPAAAGLRDLVLRAPAGLRRPGARLRPPAVPRRRSGGRPPRAVGLGRPAPGGDRRARVGAVGDDGTSRCSPLARARRHPPGPRHVRRAPDRRRAGRLAPSPASSTCCACSDPACGGTPTRTRSRPPRARPSSASRSRTGATPATT